MKIEDRESFQGDDIRPRGWREEGMMVGQCFCLPYNTSYNGCYYLLSTVR